MQHNMYAVKLLFESVHSGEPNPPKIDEDYEKDRDTLLKKVLFLLKQAVWKKLMH